MSHPEIEADDRLLTEATARVTWGDFPEDVTAYLVSEGMDGLQARALVEKLVIERNREVRHRSALKLATGLGMVLVAGIFILYFSKHRHESRGRMQVLFDASFIALGVTGIVAIWRGLNGVLLPAAEELTDVEEGEDDPPNDLPPLPGL